MCRSREQTSLGIGGTTDQLLARRYETIPEVMRLLASEGIPHRFLGGGTNVLVADGELPWVILQLPSAHPGVRDRRQRAPASMPRPISAAWSRFAQSMIWAAWKD